MERAAERRAEKEAAAKRDLVAAVTAEGEELPPEVKSGRSVWSDDVRWCYENFRQVVRHTGKGEKRRTVFVWRKAKTPAPSESAKAMMEWVAGNEKRKDSFFKDIVPKTLRGVEEEDDDLIVEEEKSLQDVRTILRKLLDRVQKQTEG